MNGNHPLHPLLFFFLTALLAFKVIRLSPDRKVRHVLSWQLAAVSFPSAVFASAQAVFLTGKIEETFARSAAAFLLLVVDAAAASLGVYWILFRKRWGIFEDQRSLVVYSLTLSVAAALTFWAGDFSVTLWLWFERLFMLVVFPLLVPPVLFALEWRLAIAPVPKILKGTPILLISTGLLALGLLGLSGIF